MKTVSLDLGSRAYDIHMAANLLDEAERFIAPILGTRRLFVIADQNVEALHGARLRAGLGNINQILITVPPGEGSKSLETFGHVVEQILTHGPERKDMVLAFGGGVIGDLAGFVAASVLRGLDFIQVPTTLLAQVDSSVGGKTGLNSAHGKNLIGAFHQPRQVLIDLDVLATLPLREMRAGYGEVIKYALINQPDFFDYLEQYGADVLTLGPALQTAILQSVEAKAAVVRADERETGQRALLNLGHTFAHAFEAAGGYDGRLLHGEAVSVGMVCAFHLSRALGLSTGQDLGRITAHLSALGMPIDLAEFAQIIDFDVEALIAAMARDKKVSDGTIRFVLARGIGQAFVSDGVPMDQVRATLTALLNGWQA